MRELILRFRGNTSGLNKSFDETRKQMGGLATEAGNTDKKSRGAFSKLAGFLGGFAKKAAIGGTTAAVAGLGYALKKGFDRLTSIENAQAKLRGLGNSTKSVEKIMDNALAAVEGTSFGLGEAANVAAGAVAAGIKPGAQLQRVLKAVANSAAAAGVPMEEMGTIFNKVSSLGKAQNDVLGQVAERGIPIYAALAKQLGVTQEEVFKLASQGKISFPQFEKAMKSASGTVADEMGKTFAGATANLKAAMGRIGAGFLGGVFPHFAPAVIKITKALKPFEKLAGQVGDKLGKMLVPAAAAAADWIGKAATSVMNFTKQLDFSSWDAFIGSVKAAGGGALSGLGKTFESIRTNAALLWPPIKELIGQMPQLGGAAAQGAAAGIQILADALSFAVKHMDVIMKVLPVLIAAYAAWKVASAATAGATRSLTAAQLAMTPVTFANNVLRVTAITLERKHAIATGQYTAAQNVQRGSLLKTVAVWAAQKTAMIASAVASKAVTAAQWLLNAALTANPIGLIIAGLVALAAGLVLAYKKSETFRNIVNGAWAGIKKVALVVANWFMNSALPMIKKVFANIAASAKLMWTGIKTVFNLWKLGISTIVKVVVAFAKHVVKNFEILRAGIASKITWVRTWMSKTWGTIRTGTVKVVTGLRDGITSRFEAIRNGIRTKIGWVGTWLAKNWRSIRDKAVNTVAALRDGVLSRFTAVRNGVRDRVATMRDWVKNIFSSTRTNAVNIVAKLRDGVISRFAKIRDWAKTSFSKIEDYLLNPLRRARDLVGELVRKFGNNIMGAAKVPVEFLIRYVYNRGIRAVFNKAAGAIPGVKARLPHVDFPAWPKFDSGGIFMPNRYTPGRDIGFAALSGGEPIMRPEFGRAVGHGTIHALNKAARTGGVQGVKNALGGFMGGFKDGGIAGSLSGGSGRFSSLAQKTLLQAQQMAGVMFNIFQRGFRPTTSYSGTSHAGDAIDLAPVTRGVVAALRRAGWAAWDRTGKGNWAPHIHAVPLPGYGHAGGSGVWQAQDYVKGGDGLGGKDNGPRGLIGKVVAGIGAVGSLAADIKDKIKKPLDDMQSRFGSSMLGDLTSGAGKAIRDFVVEKGAMLVNPLASAAHGMISSGASWLGSKFGGWSNGQLDIASVIIDVAQKLGFGDKGAKIGLSTGIVESNLRNLGYGDRDSVGVFQQRAPWGPRADRMNVAKSASMFYNGGQGGQPGLRSKDWQNMSIGDAAQAVQVSGLPWRYAQEVSKAEELLKKYKAKKYDNGGWLPPGVSTVVNKTGKPEAVFTDQQLRAIASGNSDPKVVINIDGALDPDAVARQVIGLLEKHGQRRSGISIGSRTR